MRTTWFSIVTFLVALPAWGVTATNGAFQVGETLRYNIYWGPVIAGRASLEVVGIEQVDGHDCYRLRAKAKTIGVANVLFPVNSTVDTWLDVQGLFTRRHHQERREGRKVLRDMANYDYVAGTITITNLVTGRVKRSQLPEPVCDAVSSVYRLRTKPLELNVASQFLLQEGATNLVITVNPDDRQKIRVRPLGEVDALRLEPKPTFHLVAAFNGRAWVWVSNDERKIPLLVVCDLPVGNARFVLERADLKSPATGAEETVLSDPRELPIGPLTTAQGAATQTRSQ